MGLGMGMGTGTPPNPGVHPPSLQKQEPSSGEQARACWQEQRPEQFIPKVLEGHREEQCSSWVWGPRIQDRQGWGKDPRVLRPPTFSW